MRIKLLLVAAIAVVAACSKSGDLSGNTVPEMDTLVSATWLLEHIDDPDLVVIDATVLVEFSADGTVRSLSGRDDYDAGHIPGAVFADLKGELSDADSRLEFGMPSPEQFAATMGALGVGDDSRVVLYDDMGMSWAARVWWMLRWIGFDRAALLDGGLPAWKAAGGELSTEPADPRPQTLTINLRPELIAYQDEVRASIGDDDVHLIDSMPEAHYRGEMAMYVRPGHIPGALNAPVTSLFDETRLFRPDDELATLFDTDPGSRTITYCGGGIAASANAFALTRLGYTNVAVYAASLEEWAADPDNPMDLVFEFEDVPSP